MPERRATNLIPIGELAGRDQVLSRDRARVSITR
jgi:hypothetical protein